MTTARLAGLYAELVSAIGGYTVLEMHSRKSQPHRTRVAEQFREGSDIVMFSSDVSARGMDYPDVTAVIQAAYSRLGGRRRARVVSLCSTLRFRSACRRIRRNTSIGLVALPEQVPILPACICSQPYIPEHLFPAVCSCAYIPSRTFLISRFPISATSSSSSASCLLLGVSVCLSLLDRLAYSES